VRELMAAGVLAEPLVYTHADARDLGLRDVEVSGGDFTSESLGPRMDRLRLVGNIVTHYQERVVRVRGRAVPTLCFAASVKHSKSIAARFSAAGFRAAHLDGKTPDDVRDRLIEDLKAGRLDVLCNYGVLTEGFDAPGVECIILARPTLKDHVYRQAVGRGMRKVEGSEKVVVVLDHAGLARAFGHPGEDVPVSLEEDPRCGVGRGREWKAPTKECLGCGQTVATTRDVCPFCAAGDAGGGGDGGARAGVFEEMDGELVAMIRERETSTVRLTFTVGGVTRTFAEWSLATNVSEMTIRSRAMRGLPPEEVVAPLKFPRVLLTWDGRTQGIVAWAKECGVNHKTIRQRMKMGWTDAQALGKEPRTSKGKTYEYRGRKLTTAELAAETGVKEETISTRLKRGYSVESACQSAMYSPGVRRKGAPARSSA